MEPILHYLAVRCQWASWFVLLIATGIRLTIKDRVPVISAIYYATPPVILASLAVILAFWHLTRRNDSQRDDLSNRNHRRLCGLAAVLATCWMMATVQANYRLTGTAVAAKMALFPVEDVQTVLLWNAASGLSDLDGVLQKVHEVAPPIAAIVEGGQGAVLSAWKESFPNYQFTELTHGILVMTKGEILSHEFGSLGPYGVYLNAEVRWAERNWRILAVDLLSHPLLSRRQAIQSLSRLAEQYKNQPLLVLGDFNLPRDSAHFSLLRPQLSHTFERKGVGYAATWPYPFPVLQLDHVWVNQHVNVISCCHEGSLHSDHRLVLVRCH